MEKAALKLNYCINFVDILFKKKNTLNGILVLKQLSTVNTFNKDISMLTSKAVSQT
uniref:Bm1442 n=1 Tax=Brugia malayi TaxID=6279 RepID=A0A1I9G3S3_BRUMA|nr:Bm1442 [Brugia malayi]